jgi:hypothetical protein
VIFVAGRVLINPLHTNVRRLRFRGRYPPFYTSKRAAVKADVYTLSLHRSTDFAVVFRENGATDRDEARRQTPRGLRRSQTDLGIRGESSIFQGNDLTTRPDEDSA